MHPPSVTPFPGYFRGESGRPDLFWPTAFCFVLTSLCGPGFPGGSDSKKKKKKKNPSAMQETWVRFLDWEDPLEEGMATHSSIIAWRIPMDRGAWWVPVHGVAKSRTELSDFLFPWLKWDSKGFFLPAGGSSGVGRGQRLPKLRSLKHLCYYYHLHMPVVSRPHTDLHV